ncbi:MAG: GNAT family N-acetyltransferase [Clostridia bacterium]|nr:GNAT family N-acetyltransferase [Clostridia bacterium]
MIKLIEVNDNNWLEVASLSVTEEQKRYLDSPVGILARGYAYRSARARVIGIENDGRVIGVALVKDLDEEPACYDLQQFMIDRRFQGRGYGTEALRAILGELAREHKYDRVEVCVHKNDGAALRVYEKVGFRDTGYVDEDVPDCLNLMYRF